jgi:hypothetical protein
MHAVVPIKLRSLWSALLVLAFSAACTHDDDSCEWMTTDYGVEAGELVYVMSEAEALSRANAEEWSLRRTAEEARDAGRDAAIDAEDPPRPTRLKAALLAPSAPAFLPATPCEEGTCVEVQNGYARFRFVRPTATGTYRLRDLHATLCEEGTACPSVDELARGALCEYRIERCILVDGTVVVEELADPCGEGACAAFVAEIAVVEGPSQGPTLVGRTKLLARERLMRQPCGGGGGGCGGGGWMNPMR